ncbi:integrin alpha-L [Hippoglossus stenolepis]|uniref:integrin alpha-L n=1 Tax=Hippoglossus stenolepis TaxID=195615 RepID=UPI001FAF932B|nr:integrin alpha-L [Hippoglossus stenolepis]
MWKMKDQRHIFLLTYMVALAAPLSLAFNIDATNPDVYAGEKKDFFGYKVLQFMSGTNKGIIVTAPLQLNGSGGVCRPDQNQSTQCFNAEDITVKNETLPVKLLGMSIAADSTSSQFIVCSPSVAHECNENSYLNSVCYKMTHSLQTISSFTPAFQECTNKTVDLRFFFDGSGSFSAVQFSSNHRTVFDFNNYQDGSALGKLMNEPHMEALTNTHGALEFVMKNILENPAAGASPDAIKVLVIITDGDPSDRDYGIIEEYNDKQIIRFVIGVSCDLMFYYSVLFILLVHLFSCPVFILSYCSSLSLLYSNTCRFFKNVLASACLDTLHLYAPHFQIGSYFGAELCSVDIDSDGNTDFLLVGAPLFYQPHEKKEGRIYVYILSEKMQLEIVLNVTAPSMGRFGTTISSLADLNGDELRDVAVGAPLEDDNRGAVYIYLGDRHNGIRSTFSQVNVMSSGLNISYMLNVDPVRQTYRGFFGNDKTARSLTSTCNLTANETCFEHPVNMPKCLKDTFSPISIKFNFSQVDSESASAALNVDSRRSDTVEGYQD